MRMLLKTLWASAAVTLLTQAGAVAQGVPTIDTKNTLQTIKQLEVLLDDLGLQEDMLGKAVQQVENLQAQLGQLQSIYSKIEGLRNIVSMTMSGGLDSILDGNLSDVISTFRGVATGDLSGLADGKLTEMSQSITDVLSSAGLTQADVTAMASSGVPGAERTAAQAASGSVLAATAEQTYKESGIALQRVERLVDLAKGSRDMKESIDLNTRMLAELAVLLAKNLEMTAVSSAFEGQAGVMTAAQLAEERAYMTFSNE